MAHKNQCHKSASEIASFQAGKDDSIKQLVLMALAQSAANTGSKNNRSIFPCM